MQEIACCLKILSQSYSALTVVPPKVLYYPEVVSFLKFPHASEFYGHPFTPANCRVPVLSSPYRKTHNFWRSKFVRFNRKIYFLVVNMFIWAVIIVDYINETCSQRSLEWSNWQLKRLHYLFLVDYLHFVLRTRNLGVWRSLSRIILRLNNTCWGNKLVHWALISDICIVKLVYGAFWQINNSTCSSMNIFTVFCDCI